MTMINPLTGRQDLSVQTSSDLASTAASEKCTTANVPNLSSVEGASGGMLPELALPLRPISVEQMMKALANEARRANVSTAVNALEAQGDKLVAENEKKLQELQKQVAELSKKSFWSKLCKVFQVIGAVLGIIAAGASTVVGIATGNPLLIAGGILAAALTIDGIASMASDGKVCLAAGFTKLGQALKLGDKGAQWFGFALSMVVNVVAIAVGFGAAGVASSAKTLSSIAQVGEKAAKGLSVMSKISTASNVAGSAVGIGSGISNAALTVVDYHIAQLKANRIDIDALLESLRASMKMNEDFIESEIKTAQELMEGVKKIIADCDATATTLLKASPTSA